MKKLILSLLFLLLAGCSGCRLTPVETVPKINGISVQYLRNATVKIEVTSLEGSATGTGWFIENDGHDSVVATAGHMCDPGSLYMASTKRGDTYFGLQIYDDDDNDVCLLSFPGSGRQPVLEVSPRDEIDFGENIAYMGFPMGVAAMYSGHFTGVRDDGYQVGSISGFFGASGSAVVDSKGQVIGVFSAISSRFPQLSIFTPLESVQDLKKRARLYIKTGIVEHEAEEPETVE